MIIQNVPALPLSQFSPHGKIVRGNGLGRFRLQGFDPPYPNIRITPKKVLQRSIQTALYEIEPPYPLM